MFDSLSDRLGDVFDRLRRHGALTENDVGAAMREIRIALLEADVALPVVRDFVSAVREKALGQEVLRSVTPAQMVVKIVHDHLVEVLGGDTSGARADGLDLNAPTPVVVMLVGLQGSGKTTTAAKIAKRLQQRDRKKVLLQAFGDLCRCRRLARALQTDQHDDNRGRRVQIEPVRPSGTGIAAQHLHEVIVHDLNDHLRRRDRAQHFLPERLLADRRDKIPNHRERHVCLEQRDTDLAQRRPDIVFG